MHQFLLILPTNNYLRIDENHTIRPRSMDFYGIPLSASQVYAKGNMAKIKKTIHINIYRTPRFIENVFIVTECSAKEIDIYTMLFKEYRYIIS